MESSSDLRYKAARLLSLLFVPPSATIIIFTFFALTLESGNNTYVVLYVSYLFGFILPIIMFIYLRKHGRIINSDAVIKEERIFPFTMGILFYTGGFIVFLANHVSPVTLSLWFCYISNTIIVIFITHYWKISAHMLGISGPLAALTYVLGWYGLLFSLLLIGVGWSRLYLKVHTPAQVLAGALMGFGSTYIQIYLIMQL